jgi:hypothetical protein
MIAQNITDEIAYHNLFTDNFVQACRDYSYLINRHFPERGVLKLVGDRYRLTGDQRTILYRGISSQERSAIRRSMLVSTIRGQMLIIDGYNVLFTLLNYRMGRIIFISTDGILRDAGSLHGKLRDETTFLACVGLMLNYLAQTQPGQIDVYLDSPVSHSEKHAQIIREGLQVRNLNGECTVIKSADWALKQYNHGILATSDTAIIEKAVKPVIDLPRIILESNYNASFFELSGLLRTTAG